jgi:hypothetical protein
LTSLREENVKYLYDKAHTLCTVDWTVFLGDTIREKMESVITKLIELRNVAKVKSNDSPTAIITSLKFASIFQSGNYWEHARSIPLQPTTVMPYGHLHAWDIFTTSCLKDEELLLTFQKCPNPRNTVRFTCLNLGSELDYEPEGDGPNDFFYG